MGRERELHRCLMRCEGEKERFHSKTGVHQAEAEDYSVDSVLTVCITLA